MSSLDAGLEGEVDQVEVMTIMGIPLFATLHMKSDGCWQGVGMRILVGRVPSLVIGGKGLTSEDAMLESTTSEILVVLIGHGG